MLTSTVCIKSDDCRVLAGTAADTVVAVDMLPEHAQSAARFTTVPILLCSSFGSPFLSLELEVPSLSLPALLFVNPAFLSCLVLL